MMRRFLFGTIAILLSLSAPLEVRAEKPKRDDARFFENKIRPILVKHCYACHSADAEEIGGKLLLDKREPMRTGGESGPVLVAGKPDKSLIIQALRYENLEMPPEGPLPETVISDFVEWIRRGAHDPREVQVASATPAPPQPTATGDETKLWSLVPVQNPSPLAVRNRDWVRDPLDQFVLARVEAAGQTPTSDADPATLARRLYFDLIGLPPTFDELESFVRDHQQHGPDAVSETVDRLLARPQFGEHWARYWLDVARYGESNGNDGLSRNPTFPHAWRYRDYVIAALNDDVPFDRFVTEQLAGDLLPSESPAERDRQLIATGFLALGAKPAKAMNDNFAMDVVADQIDVVGRGLLGLSVACARCHDHKFDPIPTRDYYALAGIFTSTETMWGVSANENLSAPATDLHVLQTATALVPPKDFVETVVLLDSNTGKPKAPPKSKWPAGTPLAMGVRDHAKPADAKINLKGESAKLGPAVPRGFLSAVELERPADDAEESEDQSTIDEKQSGRLQLARWLTDPSHPLTARVFVNRIWQQLFGDGIVRTPDDFGKYGERPSDPQLLDHLATRFVAEGWSTKRMIRTIALSRTYQLSVAADASLLTADPENLLFARHKRRRLTAEALRDRMLHTSGRLDISPGVGSLVGYRDILVNRAGNLHEASQQRSVYLCYLRNSPPPDLAAFDLPDFSGVTGRRDLSTLPGQALHLFNNPFVVEQARQFAESVTKQAADDAARIALAWRRAYGRDPSEEERQAAASFVEGAKSDAPEPEQAWLSFCQALMISNEFRYVD